MLRELGRSPGLAECHLENGFTQHALLPVTETVRSKCLNAVPRGRGQLQAQKHGPLWSEPKGPGALRECPPTAQCPRVPYLQHTFRIRLCFPRNPLVKLQSKTSTRAELS